MEVHFEYRWRTDKLAAFSEASDISLKEQLPWDVQQDIFVGFVFRDFPKTFKTIFEFPNYDCVN